MKNVNLFLYFFIISRLIMVNVDIVYLMNNKRSNFNTKKFKEFVQKKHQYLDISSYVEIKDPVEYYELYGDNVIWTCDLYNYKSITYFIWYHPSSTKKCHVLDEWEWSGPNGNITEYGNVHF